jgi:hypothetical protein
VETSYDRVTPELWNELRDSQAFVQQLLMGTMLGAQATPDLFDTPHILDRIRTIVQDHS